MDIMTGRFTHNDINLPAWAKKIAEELGADSTLIRKGFTPDDIKFVPDERASVHIITAGVKDRDNELVVPRGVNYKNYEANGKPVCWAHKYDILPLGSCSWLKYDKNTNSILAKTRFSKHPFADAVYEHIKDHPLSVSIGFIPIKYIESDDFGSVDWKSISIDPKALKDVRRAYLNVELLEYSITPIPSLTAACQVAVSKGLISIDDIKNLGYAYEVIDPFKKETPNEQEQPEEKEFASGAGSDGIEGEIEKEIQQKEQEIITPEINVTIDQSADVDPKVIENLVLASINKNSAGGLIIPDIGAGPDATANTFAFEIVSDTEQKEVVTKPDTANFIHIAVSGEEGQHKDHKIRTIVISKDKGISAHYCIDDKKIISYMFSTSKFTHEQAQAWVDSHSKAFDDAVPIWDMWLQEKFEEWPGLSGFAYDSIMDSHVKATSCTCPDCGNTYPANSDGTCGACPDCAEADDVQQEACGDKPKKPKKSLDEIITKNTINPDFSSEVFPPIKKEVRWNQSLSKLFDIASVPSRPASYTMAIYCQFLECKVKNIYQNDFFIWSPLMGSYLAGFKACAQHFKLKDTRAFSRYEQLEFPPSYEVIQINSKTSDDFLVQGSAFYDFEGEPIILQFTPDYYGLRTSIFTSRKNMSLNKNFIESVHAWVEKENPLKDEKMGLNGEFLEVDDRDTWDTIVLSKSNLKAAKYAAKLINEKGMDFNGRGMLMVGPPGTGKTKIARILMTQTDHTFIWVSSKDLTRTPYPEDKIALGFKMARQLSPCVLCLEDIDNWIDGKIVDMMKTELDGVKKNKGVITILTTNNPEKFPSALLDRPGRFHDVLNFDVPTKELRQEMITRWVGNLDDDALKSIVDATEGYSGAYMWELIEFAKDISESDDLDMEDALVSSLAKLSDQKDLIQSIQKPKEKSVKLEEIPAEYYEAELQAHMVATEELTKTLKSGRRLSSTSINSLREALKLIEELIASSEPAVTEEAEKSFEMVITPEPEFDLESALKSSLEDIFSRKLKHLSAEDIVSEAIKKAKGEIF